MVEDPPKTRRETRQRDIYPLGARPAHGAYAVRTYYPTTSHTTSSCMATLSVSLMKTFPEFTVYGQRSPSRILATSNRCSLSTATDVFTRNLIIVPRYNPTLLGENTGYEIER
jgi:hypothetical protein